MDMKRASTVTVAQLDAFDEVIDVRSPGEYALDHVPSALNCPVLDDEERARVGTMYKRVSPFDAKKEGAALVSRNIARHIEERFRGRGRDWRPLVYCWRGGQRSASMAHVLREIGWHAATLEGGYRAYRREVLAKLDELPARFRYRERQKPAPGSTRGARRSGARPRAPRLPPRLAAGPAPRRAATLAETVRQPGVECAQGLRSCEP